MKSFFLASFVRLLHASLRVTHIGAEKVEALPQYIIAFWHEHLMLMLHSRYRKPIQVMVSRSRDGELVAAAFLRYGIGVSRGSTTRGASAALRDMIRAARRGSVIVFTPDGPLGPRRVAKDGVIYAAQATGLPIVPYAFAAKKKSYWHRGIACSCRFRSRAPHSCTAIPSTSRAMKTWKVRDCEWRKS